MNFLKQLHRRLDLVQRTMWCKLTLSVLAVLACGFVFGSLLYTNYDLESQRAALTTQLDNQNITRRDEHAVSLYETGLIHINGVEYGDASIAGVRNLFTAEGDIDVSGNFLAAMLSEKYPENIPRWLIDQSGSTWLFGALALAWMLLIIWMCVTLPFIITVLASSAACGIAWLFDSPDTMRAVMGVGLLSFTFVLLSHFAQLLYNRPNQVFAIAHTVLKEASRTRIPLVFIVLILIMLPLLPAGLDSKDPIRYQLQTFISRGLGYTFMLAACMTLLLSCATVAFEIRDRQIWQLMTKPVGRINYLLGKWLGVITINFIIMFIASVACFTFVQQLREKPIEATAAGVQDLRLVRDEVLTARVGVFPTYQTLDVEQLRRRVDDYILRSGEFEPDEEVPRVRRNEIARDMQDAFLTGQRSIPPYPGVREYTFTGLEAARDINSMMTLRYRFHILRDDEHAQFNAAFMFNDNPNLVERIEYIPTMTHTFSIPPSQIQEDGTLKISIQNLHQPPPSKKGYGSLNFEINDFELLYQVATFEGNFFRAIVIDWVKLAFLAMLGIACATFLSFPVACLTAFTIFIAGSISPYLSVSLDDFYPPKFSSINHDDIGLVIKWIFTKIITIIGRTLVFLFEAFGTYRPTQALVEGRLVPWSMVGACIVRLGLIWSGISLIVGYLVMRKRQLAIYSGHG